MIRGIMVAVKLIVLEMAVLPLVLDDYIPLFPAGTPVLGLRLVICETLTLRSLHVVYLTMR